MKKYIDIPPVYLALGAGLAWWIGREARFGLTFGGAWADFLGGILVGGGIVVILLAVYEMRRFKTTLMPHATADQLVTSGIYSRSRNPIYVGDVLIMAGLVLRFDAVLALPLVPILLWWLETHFVIAEENRLRRKFRANFARYAQKTRRWV